MSGAPQGNAGPMRKRPRVAIVTAGFYPRSGGSETHHAAGARRLADEADVCVFASELSLPESERSATRRPVSVGVGGMSIATRYLPSSHLFGESRIRSGLLRRALGEFDPDIVWTNDPSATGFTAGRWALAHRRRWVATYHADLSQEGFLRRWFTRIEARALARSQGVMVSTDRYRDRLLGRGIPSDRIHVIQPFSRPEFVPEPTSGPATPVSPGPEHPILFVGVLDRGHAYKHPEELVDALVDLARRDIHLPAVFVGDGDRLEEVRERAERAGIGADVRFVGRVSDEELDRLYRSAWVFVLPSRGVSEGYGLVLLEALARGCPVIASSEVPGLDRFVNQGSGFRYPGGSPSTLADLLAGLKVNPAKRAEAATRARELDLRAEMRDSLEATAQVILGPSRGA
jgi:glycosyltransferase involved in cell wall biosynthesis